MTAARRGQKAAFPQLRRPTSRNFPSGAVRPNHPRQRHPARPSGPLRRGSTPSARGTGRDAIHRIRPAAALGRGFTPRSASFTTVALVAPGSASLRMTSL